MALVIYPNTDYDSFISVSDADGIINKFSVHVTTWEGLNDAQKEVYLRIATDRIFNAIDSDTYLDSTTYVADDSCLPKATALMAIHDVVYEISSSVNPNQGLVSMERVGDLQVNYFHGNGKYPKGAKKTNPYPTEVYPCLTSYGAEFNVFGVLRAKVENS